MGGGGLGAFCSSCLWSDVVKHRDLSALGTTATKRHLPGPATMLDMATNGMRKREVQESCGRKARKPPHRRPFNFQYLAPT